MATDEKSLTSNEAVSRRRLALRMAVGPGQQISSSERVDGRVHPSVEAAQFADDARVFPVYHRGVDKGGVLVHLFTGSWEQKRGPLNGSKHIVFCPLIFLKIESIKTSFYDFTKPPASGFTNQLNNVANNVGT